MSLRNHNAYTDPWFLRGQYYRAVSDLHLAIRGMELERSASRECVVGDYLAYCIHCVRATWRDLEAVEQPIAKPEWSRVAQTSTFQTSPYGAGWSPIPRS